MNAFRIIVALCVTLLLGACAGQIKMLPDQKHCVSATTVGDTLDRSSTYVALNECHKDGDRLVVGKEVKPGDLVHGQTVGGQAIVGAVGGVGAATVNGYGLYRATKLGQCAAGGNCGTVIQNQVGSSSSSVSESLLKNNVDINLGVNTCGVAGKPVCGN